MKFKTNYNYKQFEKVEGERIKSLSMTVPDQTLSIPELIRRYAQGLPLGAPIINTYNEDPEHDILQGVNFNTLDLSEKMDLIKSVKNEYDDISDRLRKPRIKREKPQKTEETKNPE